jgi:integrase
MKGREQHRRKGQLCLEDRGFAPRAVQARPVRKGHPVAHRALPVLDYVLEPPNELVLDSGVSRDDVQDLAGHADPRTTRLYDRRKREVTRNIVERISI